MSNFLYIYIVQPTPAISCDTTVATPAPATPIFTYNISIKSKAIFMTDDNTRKYTGVLLSPSERIIPDTILYKNTVGIPANIITI